MKTKTLPGSTVKIVTRKGDTEIDCKPMEVPVDREGRPFFTRCENDSHNNLRVLLSPTSYVLFNASEWHMVSIDEKSEPIVQAVQNAS